MKMSLGGRESIAMETFGAPARYQNASARLAMSSHRDLMRSGCYWPSVQMVPLRLQMVKSLARAGEQCS